MKSLMKIRHLVEKLLRVKQAVHQGTVKLFLLTEEGKLGKVLTFYFPPQAHCRSMKKCSLLLQARPISDTLCSFCVRNKCNQHSNTFSDARQVFLKQTFQELLIERLWGTRHSCLF
jgi:hypothetical protein